MGMNGSVTEARFPAGPRAPGVGWWGGSGALLAVIALALAGCAGLFQARGAEPESDASPSPSPSPWPRHKLSAERWWLLNLPEGRRLDASGLLRFPDGEMWTVNDQDAAVYRLRFRESTNTLDLERIEGLLTREQSAELNKGSRMRLDCEGLARDERGRIYLSEESRRMVLRWDPSTKAVERLPIDWAPVTKYFHSPDMNASFEGIAVGGDRLYVANERQTGRLIVVDLATLKVIDDFAVASAGSTLKDTHYTDLCWAEGALWVLLRDERKVLKVDPAKKAVVEEFDYNAMEVATPTAYGIIFAPGFMEGIAVDSEFLWLLVDNNGVGRRVKGGDARPTLFRCRRPDLR